MRRRLLSADAASAARERLRANMVRLTQGDREALRDIYNATHAKLFGICLCILNDRMEAEDALQDVYLTLWRRADRYDPEKASPISWLATFARNRAVDRLRSGKVRQGAVPVDEAMEVADNTPHADSLLEDAEHKARIHHCLSQLEEPTQSSIRSAFLEGRTYAELAEAADTPLGTMKSRIRRGLAKLKTCLEAE